MGLGLSITYGIVDQFGGKIEISDGPEGGAVFTVILNKQERS
jgi:two-component system C4-dicarboxylate transport sensor histidine kinase DctB